MMYWGGDGVCKNAATARNWIIKAGRNGEILATLQLARAYETGELGFPIGSDQAKWQARKRRFARPARRRRR